jgi:hypothetical protein
LKTLAVLIMLLAIAGCAHSPANLNQDLIATSKQCDSKQWPSEEAKVDCQYSAGLPIVQRDDPVLVPAWEHLNSKIKMLAHTLGEENAPVQKAWNKYLQGEKEATAVLIAHEPQFAQSDSTLSKDLQTTNPHAICTTPSFVTRMKCFDSIMRPIWERDAPETLTYYEEYQKKRVALAKTYDATGAPQLDEKAFARYMAGRKKAQEELVVELRQVREQQQARSQQVANMNQQQQAEPDWGAALAQGLATYANARVASDQAAINSMPQRTVCNNYLGTVYCNTSR